VKTLRHSEGVPRKPDGDPCAQAENREGIHRRRQAGHQPGTARIAHAPPCPRAKPARAPSVPRHGERRYAPEETAPPLPPQGEPLVRHVELDPSVPPRGEELPGKGEETSGSWSNSSFRRWMRPGNPPPDDCPGPPARSPRVPFPGICRELPGRDLSTTWPGCSTRRNERSSPGREGNPPGTGWSRETGPKAGPRQTPSPRFRGRCWGGSSGVDLGLPDGLHYVVLDPVRNPGVPSRRGATRQEVLVEEDLLARVRRGDSVHDPFLSRVLRLHCRSRFSHSSGISERTLTRARTSSLLWCRGSTCVHGMGHRRHHFTAAVEALRRSGGGGSPPTSFIETSGCRCTARYLEPFRHDRAVNCCQRIRKRNQSSRSFLRGRGDLLQQTRLRKSNTGVLASVLRCLRLFQGFCDVPDVPADSS